MAKKAKAYVLDSWAVIAYLEDEPSAEQVEELIATAHEEQIPIYMSVVNVEKFGIRWRGKSQKKKPTLA